MIYFPTAACEALDARFSDGLGEHTRRLAYYWALWCTHASFAPSLGRTLGQPRRFCFPPYFP